MDDTMRTLDETNSHEELASLRQTVARLETELAEARQVITSLRERKARFRKTFDQAGVGIAHVSAEGRFLYANRRVTEILGYQAEELYERTFFELTHPDDTPETHDNARRLTATEGSVVSIEKRYLHKDGHTVWVHLVTTLVHDDETDERYYLSILDDISTRRRAAEFKKAMEAAEAANRAKSEFLANMSHEIRTPVNGIMGMTQLVLTTRLTEDQRDCLQTVMVSSEALLEIINSILDLSKIDAGKLELDEVEFSLRELLFNAIRPLEPQAHEKQIELTWGIDVGVPDKLCGDPGRLRQVLLNLTGNAIKFTQQGSVQIRVEKLDTTEEATNLRFSVADTGIGIPPELQKKIFTPFEQADGSTTRLFGGTGLGLSIAQELVKMMQGSLSLKSTPNIGSTFSFNAVFRRDARSIPPTEVNSLADDEPSIPPPPAPLRVLVVEDNRVNQKVTSKTLEHLGYAVELAHNGADALELLEHHSVDLILMDVQMPQMNGLEATRRIREKEQARGNHTVIIGLTASAMSGDKQRCLDAGMDAYLSKPIYPDQLRDAIRQHTESRVADSQR